jgi:hypothetical protein
MAKTVMRNRAEIAFVFFVYRGERARVARDESIEVISAPLLGVRIFVSRGLDESSGRRLVFRSLEADGVVRSFMIS